MKKLNDDLQSIHNIMRKTIDDVLGRGDKLDGESESAVCAGICIECQYLWPFCVAVCQNRERMYLTACFEVG